MDAIDLGAVREKTESRKDILKASADWLEGHIKGVLEKRQDGEAQLDHLVAVSDNTRRILRAEQNAPLSPEQETLIKLFQFGHDRGKWEIAKAEELLKSDKRDSLIKKLDLTKDEISLLDKASEDTRSPYSPRKDIAHHLYSAVLMQADMEEGGKLSNMSDDDKKRLNDAILAHQFGGYYKGVALKEGYSQKEIDAITRDISPEPYERACHDGDQLSMAQLGDKDIDGKFHLGGYGKVVLIGIGSLQRGGNDRIKNIRDCFESSDESVVAVGSEIVTDVAKQIYLPAQEQSKKLTEAIFRDNSPYSELLDSVKPGLSPEGAKKVYEDCITMLKVESERLSR